MSLEALDKKGNTLSKQAIDARFTSKSTLFIKTVFENYLQKCNHSLYQNNDFGWMDLFSEVLIKDGTRFDLPEAFKDHFKGFGGKCTSDSAICIQFEYDLKSGLIKELKTTSANIPDSKDAQITKDEIQPDSLILRDLGYFGLDIFEEMNLKKAYYISKLNTQVYVYEKIKEEFKLLNFAKLHQRFKKTDLHTFELDVFMGKDHKIPIRMAIEKVPPETYQQRMHKANKENRKKGYTMRKEYAARQHFNMYITNIEKAKLSAEAIRNIYRLRWQVELVFKTWKSTYNIDKTHKMKYERWMTLFYAKMLVMLIHWQIYHLVNQTKFKLKNKLLSISKSIKSLQLVSNKITALIRKGIAKFKETITQLIELIEKKHDLERKKGRKNQQEIIGISYCMSAD